LSWSTLSVQVAVRHLSAIKQILLASIHNYTECFDVFTDQTAVIVGAVVGSLVLALAVIIVIFGTIITVYKRPKLVRLSHCFIQIIVTVSTKHGSLIPRSLPPKERPGIYWQGIC